MKKLRRPSPSMVVSMVALFVALGGTGYAAVALAPNSVGSPQVKNNSLTGKDIKNDKLTGKDVKESALGKVPSAATADSATSAASATNAGHATNADSATNATNATNAGHATSADSAGVVNGGDAKNLVAGYATITAGVTPTVKNFGGKRVTDVTVTRVGAGNYDVTFAGSFPGVTSVDQIATESTIWDSDNYNQSGVSNDQSTASDSSITIRVFVWSDNTTTPPTLTDTDFTVSFFAP